MIQHLNSDISIHTQKIKIITPSTCVDVEKIKPSSTAVVYFNLFDLFWKKSMDTIGRKAIKCNL